MEESVNRYDNPACFWCNSFLHQGSCCTQEPHSNQRWRDVLCLLPGLMTRLWWRLSWPRHFVVRNKSCTRSEGSCFSSCFLFKRNAKRRCFLVADLFNFFLNFPQKDKVPCFLCPMCLYHKWAPAKGEQGSVPLCTSTGFTLSHWNISPQNYQHPADCVFPLLRPPITPKQHWWGGVRTEKRGEWEVGWVMAAMKAAFEISPRSFTDTAATSAARYSPRERLKSKRFVKTP